MPTVTEYLRCEFTEPELVAMSRTVAREIESIVSAQETLKEVRTSIGAQIAAHDKRMQELSRLINQGYEYRNVACEVQFDMPESGFKTITRCDNGSECRVEPMTAFDRQGRLPLEDVPEETGGPPLSGGF